MTSPWPVTCCTAQPGHPRYPSTGVVAHALHGGGTRAQSRETLQWARNHQPQVSKAAPGLVAIGNLTGETATRLATLLLSEATRRGLVAARRRRRSFHA